MFAVIRAGGKQYRVAPGDVIRLEKQSGADSDGNIEFNDVLAVSPEAGKIGPPQGDGSRVLGTILNEGVGKKILVFHYKRKKQYKKLRGHRQQYTDVRITEISFGGQKFSAPGLPKAAKKAAKVVGTAAGVVAELVDTVRGAGKPKRVSKSQRPGKQSKGEAHAQKPHAKEAKPEARHAAAKPAAKRSAAKKTGKKK